MTERNPPALATWVLEHAVVGPSASMLAGDLIEMYMDGRSRFWYTRQVAIAVLAAVMRQARRRRILTLRAFAATYIGANALWSLLLVLPNAVASLAIHQWAWGSETQWTLSVYYLILIAGACGFVAVGWIVGRLHPDAHLAGVVAFVAIVLVLTSAIQIRLATSTFVTSETGMLPWWAQFAFRQWLWAGSLVVGALLSADGADTEAGGHLSARARRISRADS